MAPMTDARGWAGEKLFDTFLLVFYTGGIRMEEARARDDTPPLTVVLLHILL